MKLENSAVQLKLLLTSPHIGALKLKADISLNTVSKLLEMVQLLLECQKQVCVCYCCMCVCTVQWVLFIGGNSITSSSPTQVFVTRKNLFSVIVFIMGAKPTY